MKNVDLKRKYIQATFEIVNTGGRQSVTIRRLASELHCNPASLYRCFADLDELFLYTGLKYVESYLEDLRVILEEEMNSLDKFLTIWRLFIKHSFSNPKMFNSMYFGTYSHRLSYATQEYFTTLFPEELVHFEEEAKTTFMHGSFGTHDTTISKALKKCVLDGYIKEEDWLFIDKLFTQVFKAYLKDMVDGRETIDTKDKLIEEVMFSFTSIIDKYKLS